ncbi:alpha/beta hydrolase [Saccharopolyspora hirsuta]|uniref:alpha/beta hydrolase family protein n=1 Tax=Saccharopolyspora hirsuta TaxID=1837 RepID=UPI003321DB42
MTLRLPEPSGPHAVGVIALHLVDPSRNDPWDSGIDGRELMVSAFYPARDVRGCPVAPHLTPAAAEAFAVIDPVAHPELPTEGVDWAATRSHSHVGAPVLPGRWPVLLHSPGGADPRTFGTGLAEELASRGHVVLSFDHPGETTEVEFPGGRLRTISMPGDPRADPQLFRRMLATRVADTRFVLDAVTELPGSDAVPEDLARALDVTRIGMYGHSAGGATAAEALYEDSRLKAAINLEGYLDLLPERPGEDGALLPVAEHGVDRPLLLLGTDGFRDERFERTWRAVLDRGSACWEQLADANHWVFTDHGVVAPQLQAAGLMSEEDRIRLVGAIDPADSVRAIRHHVLGFFAENL